MKLAANLIVSLSLVITILLTWSKSTVLLGQLAFYFLTLVIFTKPLARLFPTIALFKYALALRRYTGITSGLLAIGHVLTLVTPSFGLVEIINFSASAGPKSFQLWGLIGLVLILPLLLTANNVATNFLKRHWFLLHKLVHPLYLVVLIHRALQPKPYYLASSLFLFISLYFFRFLAGRGVRFFVSSGESPNR